MKIYSRLWDFGLAIVSGGAAPRLASPRRPLPFLNAGLTFRWIADCTSQCLKLRQSSNETVTFLAISNRKHALQYQKLPAILKGVSAYCSSRISVNVFNRTWLRKRNEWRGTIRKICHKSWTQVYSRIIRETFYACIVLNDFFYFFLISLISYYVALPFSWFTWFVRLPLEFTGCAYVCFLLSQFCFDRIHVLYPWLIFYNYFLQQKIIKHNAENLWRNRSRPNTYL